MGKIKIINKKEDEKVEGEALVEAAPKTSGKTPKAKIVAGTLHVEATFNNTKVVLSDKKGNTLFWTSAGALGFKGAKKGTPFAAAKVGETLGAKASVMGMKDVHVLIKGVGSGREPAVRAFSARGFEITGIKDTTPIPHNGPKPKKPRRV